MQNLNYNYMLRTDKEIPQDFDIDNRSDPDTKNGKELYDDERDAFWGDNENEVEVIVRQYGNKPRFCTIRVNKFLFSSDYIGPSVYWARKCGIDDDKIRDFLNICRRLGGHILFPRGKGKPTFNLARAGSGGLYDRIDWSLHLLKIYYSMKNDLDKKKFIAEADKLLPKEFRNKNNFTENFSRVFESLYLYKDEFNYFESFEGFCDRFKLKKSFVDENCDVINMAELFPILPREYDKYIDNLCIAIKDRNEILHNSTPKR